MNPKSPPSPVGITMWEGGRVRRLSLLHNYNVQCMAIFKIYNCHGGQLCYYYRGKFIFQRKAEFFLNNIPEKVHACPF